MNPLLDKFDKEFDEIRCKSGSVGLKTDDLKDSGFYNIHKCGICGRKWHIYEQAPICSKYREKYPDELSLAHSHLEEAYRARLEDGAEPKKFCITCLEKTGEIVPSHSDQSNLERLIEKCGDKLMSIHRTVPPKNMGDYWCAEAYFEMEKDEETPLSGRIGLGSTPTEAVENLIKALEKK